ncbi:hypothetical protein J3R82DRAFT_11580 [Butyriboletus roseoflavus]|nr:hypothetical protein J3R82DRAFT_11580 [Butyriboletus roseoflavus]
MPRRTSTRTVTTSATPHAPAIPQQLDTPYDSNIHQLRRHWKWAAFAQFFFTFSPIFAMPDVTLIDVENDLVHSTNRVLSRIMQRLLITLTQDRKITTDSWQNALRRQYQRRDPEASPIGLMARSQHFIVESSRASTAPPGSSAVLLDEPEPENESLEHNQSTTAHPPDNTIRVEGSVEDPDHISVTKDEEEDVSSEALEPPERQVDWLDLSMLAKLESLHTLVEWQFQNPHRVRQQMKTDDEQATWVCRGVSTFCPDPDRLPVFTKYSALNPSDMIPKEMHTGLLVREPPRLNLKRKRKPGRNTTKEQPQSLSVKRQRIDLDFGAVGQSSVARTTRGKAQIQPSQGSREGRAAKTRANQRLDAQARDLADFRRQMVSSRTRAASITPHKPTGTRISARLRGTAVEEDGWQEVPDEWLAVSDTQKSPAKDSPSGPLLASKKKMRTGLESDDSSISELTELSDGEDDMVGAERNIDETPVVETEETDPTSAEKNTNVEAEDPQGEEAKLVDPPITPPFPDDFVEWETICVTLEEWESIEQQFEKANHYAEKALHKVLSQSIVPMVTAELREAEKKRRMEDAVVHRKRSSRIAMKEFEKEEERAAMRKRVEEEEKMSRARRLEARQQKEQVERLRRENAREHRRMERELQEQQSTEKPEAEASASVNIVEEETNCNSLLVGQSKAPVVLSATPINGTGSGSHSPVENWELDCEVCGRKGINQDNGVPLLCCGICGKWQHIICHDRQDTMAGRPKRNWDIEDFICRQCHLITPKSSSLGNSASLLSLGVNSKRGQASSTQTYYGQPSNHPRSYPNSGYYQNSPPNARYPYDHPDVQTAIPSPSSHSYTSQTRPSGVTFAHYQPQQGGFSTSRPTYSVQDGNPSQHARYTIAPHTTSATGIASYPSTFHTQAITHPPAHVHEQWLPSSSYPRTTNSHPLNGGPLLHSQGIQPYYNGHAHPSHSQMRGTTNSTVLGQYAGLQHVPSYQHSK